MTEDEVDIMLFLSVRLRMAGHTVLTAQDGATALEKARSNELDAILLDMRLPDMDGWTVIEGLREIGLFPTTPVIVASADAEPARAEKAAALGCRAYLTKPFDVDLLLATLAAIEAGD